MSGDDNKLPELTPEQMFPRSFKRLREMLSMTATVKEKLACVRRELAMRKNFYPTQVARGKMRQIEAEHELRVMMAIIADYEQQEQAGQQ